MSCPLEGGPVHAGQSDGRTARAIAGRGSGQALTRLDGFRPTDTDQEEQKRTWNQSAGEFLIDRGGIVRWAFVEYASGDLTHIGKFPEDEEVMAAARMLTA